MAISSNPLRGEDVRQKNEKLILHAILQHGSISQSEIVSLTGLKAPTVLRIFSYLEKNGLIQVNEQAQRDNGDRKGRRPVYFQVNPRVHYVIGIELWSKQVSLVVTDFAKRPVYSRTLVDDAMEYSEQLYRHIAEMITEAVDSLGLDQSQILGIGVGAPGRIKVTNGEIIYYSRIKNLENFPLGKRLEEEFGLPVMVNNNASVLAVNAFRRGQMDSSRTLLTILIRTGVGGAYICHGTLLTPQGRTAVELGHLSVDMHGRECVCGAKGCLETYLSEVALREDAADALGTASLEDLDKRIAEQEPRTLEFMKQRAEYLSVAARDLYRLFAPDTILIITRYEHISKCYRDMIYRTLQEDSFCHKEQGVEVTASVYDPEEACRGAADLIFDAYFMMEQ